MNRFVGCDFTSAPSSRKPLVNVWVSAADRVLRVEEICLFSSYDDWRHDLRSKPEWIGCFDFPFSLPRKFLQTVDWPTEWSSVADRIEEMTKPEFLAFVQAFATVQPYGSKEPSRQTERAVGSFSAIKLGRPSMARMAFEGISKLRSVADRVFPYWGEGSRIAVEAYAGVVARRIVGRRSYKGASQAHSDTRAEILAGLPTLFDIELQLPEGFVETVHCDHEADQLDALIAAIQGWWATTLILSTPNLPHVEGWIADENSLPLLFLI